MSDDAGLGPATPELLLRELLPDGQAGTVRGLQELGWAADHLEVWGGGAPAVVLYDPVDGRMLGAGLAGELRPGCFQLLAAMVASGLVDREVLCERIVRAVGDRVRRLGGEHLAVPLQGSGLSDTQLTAMGLVNGPANVAGTGAPAAPDRLGYLEL
jgi:hypothetical protein